jgi:TRAP-type mannitol/chloroaromatic compound transport system substrate-binding protein
MQPKQSSPASRRHFLARAAATTAGAAAAGFPMIAVAQSPAVLRFQGAWAARDIFHEYALDYARKVNEMSGGRLRIEVLAAGAVVKPRDLLPAVDKGVLDGCHADPSYWAGKDTAFSLFGSGPALGMDANLLLSWMEYGGGRQLYEEVYARVLHRNVTGFLYGPMPAQPLGWFRKPLASAAQMKGMRVHGTDAAAALARSMGAVVPELADDQIAPAARRGQLDGAAPVNPSRDSDLGLPEALPVCMLQSHHRPAQVFEVLFNRQRFEALPADLKAIARYAAQAASADLSWKAVDRHSAEHARLRARAATRFQKTPPDVLRAQLKAWSAIAERQARDNPYYDRILKSQQAWARRVVGWSLDAAIDPRIAYDYWFARPAGAVGSGKP